MKYNFIIGILWTVVLFLIGSLNNHLTKGEYAHPLAIFLTLLWLCIGGVILIIDSK